MERRALKNVNKNVIPLYSWLEDSNPEELAHAAIKSQWHTHRPDSGCCNIVLAARRQLLKEYWHPKTWKILQSRLTSAVRKRELFNLWHYIVNSTYYGTKWLDEVLIPLNVIFEEVSLVPKVTSPIRGGPTWGSQFGPQSYRARIWIQPLDIFTHFLFFLFSGM